jgi:hypothetical protein
MCSESIFHQPLKQTWFLPSPLAVDIMNSSSVIFESFKTIFHIQRMLPVNHVCLMILVATNFNKPHAFANQLK